MRYVSIDSVEPGHILARSIYTSDGMALLNVGVQLTVGMLSTLRRLGVTHLYIQDERFADVEMEDVVSEQTRREALASFSMAVQCVQAGKSLSSKAITDATSSMIDEIMRNQKVLINLNDIRTKDNEQFLHALQVCTLSTVIGVNLGLPRAQLQELAIGSLLHDIGKCEVPEKEKKQEDAELSGDTNDDKQHTWRGYKRLRKIKEFSITIPHVALQHHEHVDGTGYPRQLSGEDIHRYGKIVAVANFFDNLVAGQGIDGKRMMPHEATEYLMGFAGKRFDLETVIGFLRCIAIYPNGTSVKLSTGQVGVVVGQHTGLPARPIVRVFTKDSDDHEVKELDLAKETTLFITHVLQG
ncbi:HD-GYP domain-containing protein [Effusibacillus dendaii]|uniref:C-di-GMP phosphodiesterase n=1 Tax=Effusibacillus dendaii TaxID=2743772 RepID=A0A7I8DDX3_9BACL|nr:HD domain-containing phosphohydrolase [Effusibacillus dendaii]BCJ87026.1 c-di-GMP phosphodiesterase [Effusibacillus dendaii]